MRAMAAKQAVLELRLAAMTRSSVDLNAQIEATERSIANHLIATLPLRPAPAAKLGRLYIERSALVDGMSMLSTEIARSSALSKRLTALAADAQALEDRRAEAEAIGELLAGDFARKRATRNG